MILAYVWVAVYVFFDCCIGIYKTYPKEVSTSIPYVLVMIVFSAYYGILWPGYLATRIIKIFINGKKEKQ